jgi:hypothetical protein
LTRRLKEAGKIMSIELLDHLITGERNYISLKETGLKSVIIDIAAKKNCRFIQVNELSTHPNPSPGKG